MMDSMPAPLIQFGFSEEDSEFEWEDVCECLTQWMEEINPGGKWHAIVHNFGWQKLNGHKDFNADTGEELLGQILPKTDCHFKITQETAGDKKYLKLQNWHHDSNTGDEYYEIAQQNDG